MAKQAMSSRTAREARRHETIVRHDSPRAQQGIPPMRGRPMRRLSRHDVAWEHLEPALNKPLRPWDRPLPRPTRARGRTHGRSARRSERSKRSR